MKKGFTLIELLATIVLLAVIGMIGYPIILNIIRNAREDTAKDSTYALAEAARVYESRVRGTASSNELVNVNLLDKIEYDGKQPENYNYNGYGVYINEFGDIGVAVSYDNKCYKKDFKEAEVKISDFDNKTCRLTSGLVWKSEVEEIIPEGSIYYIKTPGNLAWISEESKKGNTFENRTFILDADIDMGAIVDSEGNLVSGTMFYPIGKDTTFKANFDGNNHTISNIYISYGEEDDIGLFSQFDGNEIKDLTLKDSFIYGRNRVGIICKTNNTNTIIDNVKSIDNIIVAVVYNAAGVVSYFKGSKISNCYNNSYISSEAQTAGIVDYVINATIENNKNEGSINSLSGAFTSGIVMYAETGIIKNNENKGKITGNDQTSGIVGRVVQNGSVLNNNNQGEVNGYKIVGGIIGGAKDTSITNNNNKGEINGEIYVGGIVGTCSAQSFIKNNQNSGKVIATSTGTGGIIGIVFDPGSTIDGNKNTGLVQGEEKWIGGIIGIINGSVRDKPFIIVSNNVNYGKIQTLHGAFRVGGIVGNANLGGLIYNNVNYGEINGVGDSSATNIFGAGGIVGTFGNFDYEATNVEDQVYSPSYIINCYNKGNVIGGSASGGVIGNIYIKAEPHINILNVYNEGNVTLTTGSYVGGLIGGFKPSDLSNVVVEFLDQGYNRGIVKGSTAGGLIGSNVGIKNSINFAASDDTKTKAVINRYASGIKIENVYYDSSMTSSYGTAKSKSQMDKNFMKSILTSGAWNFDEEYPRLYKANVIVGDNKTITVTYTNEILK